jgi:hypothetical protein
MPKIDLFTGSRHRITRILPHLRGIKNREPCSRKTGNIVPGTGFPMVILAPIEKLGDINAGIQ